MSLSWMPDSLRQQLIDAVIEFITKQSEDFVGQQLSDRIRALSSKGALRKELNKGLERGIARFQQEYADIDEDLTVAIVENQNFWQDRTVQEAVLKLVSMPGLNHSTERETVVAHFETMLPHRRNRERVDRAISYLLRTVAEEVWVVPGAHEIRELYALQMQRVSAEALQQQVALLRAQLQATNQLGSELRQALLQLTAAAEQRLLAVSTTSAPPQHPRPYHNLPQRNYTQFIGRQEELQILMQRLHPRSRHFLVTLVGIGGVGKSTLALECAYRYRDGYADMSPDERFESIIWVSAKQTVLTGHGIQQRQHTFSTLADLYRAIAIVLEQPTISQMEPAQQRGLVEHVLSSQRTLLIVDNHETIDDEALLTFLQELPEPTKVVLTTRHRIDSAYPILLSGMPRADALSLLTIEAERKQVVLPVKHIDALLRKTGSVPLALVWSIGLMSLGHTIESVLRRLGGGHSDIAHFCFKEVAVDLRESDAERVLFALALFDGGVGRTILGSTAGLGTDEVGRDDALAQLEQLSLVAKAGGVFSMLPLTRTFALHALAEKPDLEQELRGYWIATLTNFAQPYQNADWRWRDLKRLQQEGIHLITLAAWAQETTRIDVFLSVLPAVLSYYDITGQWTNLLSLSMIGLDYAQLMDNTECRLYIQNVMAWVLSQQGKHAEAEQVVRKALRTAAQRQDMAWYIDLLQTLSQVMRRRELFDVAVTACAEALERVQHLPPDQQSYVRANIEYELGKIARDRKDWTTAQRWMLSARGVYHEEVKNPAFNLERAWGLLTNLGFIAQQLGNLDSAADAYQKALPFFREEGGIGNVATLLTRMAMLEEQRGELKKALAYAQEALELSKRLDMVQEQSLSQQIWLRLRRTM